MTVHFPSAALTGVQTVVEGLAVGIAPRPAVDLIDVGLKTVPGVERTTAESIMRSGAETRALAQSPVRGGLE